MKVYTLVVGVLSTNCYIVSDDANNAVIIDPGEEAGRIQNAVEELGVRIDKILITHGHMDHMRAAAALAAAYGCPIVIHKDELDYMRSEEVKRSPYSARSFEEFLKAAEGGCLITDDAIIHVGDLTFRAVEVPGHTSHSVCYYMEQEQAVFCGDTLFCGGVGRTDFYNGSSMDLICNIRSRLLVLPDAVRVLPGHGPQSTIGIERRSNPYLGGAFT